MNSCALSHGSLKELYEIVIIMPILLMKEPSLLERERKSLNLAILTLESVILTSLLICL